MTGRLQRQGVNALLQFLQDLLITADVAKGLLLDQPESLLVQLQRCRGPAGIAYRWDRRGWIYAIRNDLQQKTFLPTGCLCTFPWPHPMATFLSDFTWPDIPRQKHPFMCDKHAPNGTAGSENGLWQTVCY